MKNDKRVICPVCCKESSMTLNKSTGVLKCVKCMTLFSDMKITFKDDEVIGYKFVKFI